MDFVGAGDQLTRDEIIERAVRNNVQPAALLAVVDVEAAGEGYISKTDLRMKMLFESRIFSSKTNHQYDSRYPDISTRVWTHNYGAGGAHQYDRLAKAVQLNEDAALQACSWGIGQVLGMNYELLGFKSVYGMIDSFKQSEDNQFDGMLVFCQKTGALKRLQQRDFAGFARIYNGPGQIVLYSGRINGAYIKHLQDFTTPTTVPRTDPEQWDQVLVRGMMNDPRVAKVQLALHNFGFYPEPPYKEDGDFGGGTEWAVMQFQSAQNLVRDGVVGPSTYKALGFH